MWLSLLCPQLPTAGGSCWPEWKKWSRMRVDESLCSDNMAGQRQWRFPDSYYWRLPCHEQFENSSRLGALNNRDPDPHICIVQSDSLFFLSFFFKYVTEAWLKFVYVSKRTFSRKILLPRFSFPFDFIILQSTNMGADDVQAERKGSQWNQGWTIRGADELSGNMLERG